MNIITKLFLLLLFGLFNYQLTIAQTNPAISAKYSNEEIERIIDSYRIAHTKSIYPSKSLVQQLKTDFINAKNLNWKSAFNIYECRFNIERIDYTAYYYNNKSLLMYTLVIKEIQLPAIVKNAIQAKYPNYSFENIKKTVRGSETFYKVKMKKEDLNVIAIFKMDGNFIKDIFD